MSLKNTHLSSTAEAICSRLGIEVCNNTEQFVLNIKQKMLELNPDRGSEKAGQSEVGTRSNDFELLLSVLDEVRENTSERSLIKIDHVKSLAMLNSRMDALAVSTNKSLQRDNERDTRQVVMKSVHERLAVPRVSSATVGSICVGLWVARNYSMNAKSNEVNGDLITSFLVSPSVGSTLPIVLFYSAALYIYLRYNEMRQRKKLDSMMSSVVRGEVFRRYENEGSDFWFSKSMVGEDLLFFTGKSVHFPLLRVSELQVGEVAGYHIDYLLSSGVIEAENTWHENRKYRFVKIL